MDIEPQELLPEPMQDRWAVVPRATLYQLFMVGALIGAGVAMSVVGFTSGPGWLRYAFPISLILAQLMNWLIPWERGAMRQLREITDAAD